MRLTKFTHACVRLEDGDRVLVVDPGEWSEEAALDGVDSVLVTHEHYDHVDIGWLTRVAAGNPRFRVYAPASVTDKLAELGGAAVTVSAGDTFTAGGFDLEREDGLDGTAGWWRRVYESNVISAVLLTEALRDRLAHPAGRVILLSSVAAQRGRAGPYSAAKAALHGWAYDLARELGAHGATVNVIAPGYIAETEFFGGRLTDEGHATRVAETLVGRAGRPADIAAAVRYLTGPDSGYVTGQILSVNGGIVFGR